jgi:hypothetical protein
MLLLYGITAAAGDKTGSGTLAPTQNIMAFALDRNTDSGNLTNHAGFSDDSGHRQQTQP